MPDWGAASVDWHGVHLSLGGLLSCEQGRCESAEGWSMHESWHAERTFWLRALDTVCERMPDYHGGQEWPAPSGEKRTTFPPYQPPTEDRPGIMVLRKVEPGEEPPDIEALLEAERRRIAGLEDEDGSAATEGE